MCERKGGSRRLARRRYGNQGAEKLLCTQPRRRYAAENQERKNDKHEDEEVFSDSVIAEKLKNAKIEEIHTYADFIGKENDIKLVLKQITFHFSNSSDYQFPINEDYKVFIN